jgi:hypothetical protein
MKLFDYSLWLYGSHARGDIDDLSDLDILLIGTPPSSWRSFVPFTESQLSVSGYSWQEIRHMLNYGSLFLHHVRLEGRPIAAWGPRSHLFSEELRRLKPYEKWQTDLKAFRLTLQDVVEAVAEGSATSYEMSVTATVARHAAILGCYLLGKPAFGRMSAFATIAGLLNIPQPEVDYWSRIYLFNLHEEGRVPLPNMPNAEEVLWGVESVRRLLSRIEEEVQWIRADASGN